MDGRIKIDLGLRCKWKRLPETGICLTQIQFFKIAIWQVIVINVRGVSTMSRDEVRDICPSAKTDSRFGDNITYGVSHGDAVRPVVGCSDRYECAANLRLRNGG